MVLSNNTDIMIDSVLQNIDSLKKELDALRPLSEEILISLQDAMEMEYTYESNRIEGNTLTLQETALVVKEGLTISGKSMREHLEAIGHAEAVEYIKELVSDAVLVSENVIKDIHAIVLRSIDKRNAGRYRTVPVMITGSRHIPPQPYMVQKEMEDFLETFYAKEAEGVHPVLLAAYLHDELVRIHPFIDGNGRTSRLLMNMYLLSKGYCMVVLKGSNDDRVRYYKALEKSYVDHDSDDFYGMVAEAEYSMLQKYILFIEGKN